MTGRLISLHQLSLRDLSPRELVAVARPAGYSSVSVFLHPPAPQLDIFPRLAAGEETTAFRRVLAGEGVAVHNIEALPFSGRTDPELYLPVLDQAAEIGAKRATALIYDRDLGRAAATLVRSCDAAAARGIAISIEFMAFSALKTVRQAADFVRSTGHGNLSLLVDPLHLARTGGHPDELPPLADTIGALQFCDAPRTAPADPFQEAVEDRGVPGEGDLPLQALLDRTFAGLPLDIEVPMLRLQLQGVSAPERARRLKESLAGFSGL